MNRCRTLSAVLTCSATQALVSCGVSVDGAYVTAVLPKDGRGAYVLVYNNTNETVTNMDLVCRFQLKNGAITERNVHFDRLDVRTRYEVRPDVAGRVRDARKATCKPVSWDTGSSYLPVGVAPISIP